MVANDLAPCETFPATFERRLPSGGERCADVSGRRHPAWANVLTAWREGRETFTGFRECRASGTPRGGQQPTRPAEK